MLKDLVKVASRLNSLGLSSEANFIDSVVRKFAHKEEVYGLDTSEEEAFENRKRSPYGREDGGHRAARGSRENPRLVVDPDKWFEASYNAANPIPGGNKRGRNRRGISALSDDARDGHRSSKYPPLEYDSEGRIIFPKNEPDFSGEPVTHYRRTEPTGGGGRRIHVPSETPSSYTGDEDLVIERLAKRLSSLGLTKEARILSSIIKSAGDNLDRELEKDQDSGEWTDKQWAEYESTAGPNGNGTRDIWEATSEDIAEDGDISDRAERAGIMAWVKASKAGAELEDCKAAYDDAVAAYKEKFGTEESEF